MRERVADAGGADELGINELLSAFGVRRATPETRREVEEALRAAGMSVEPPLVEATPTTRVRLELVEEPEPEEPEMPLAEDGDDPEQVLDDVLAAACDVL